MLPWLQEPFERTLSLHGEGRLPHGLLVRGYEGWGEVVFAEALARALLGLKTDAALKTVAHPDLKWIEPDGAVIKVDAIREVAAFATGTRQAAPCKVAVIEAAELMNEAAANALLKTLEEPPPDTYLILASARPARLLPTVISRCQAIALLRDKAGARKWLAEQDSEGPDIDEKLFECGGAPLLVASALAAGEPALGPVLGRLAASTPVSQAIGELLDWDLDRLTGAWYRHCSALLAGESRIPGVDAAGGPALAAFVQELAAIRRQLLTTNSANARILLERLLVRWQSVLHAAA
ncbi:MAG: hypothetical protein AAGE43_13520 [Pseudomonadota bacterium]